MKKKQIEIFTSDDDRLTKEVKTELEKIYPHIKTMSVSRAWLVNKIIDYALGIDKK